YPIIFAHIPDPHSFPTRRSSDLNILLVLINGFFLFEALAWIGYGSRLLDFRFPSPNDKSPEAIRMLTMFNWYVNWIAPVKHSQQDRKSTRLNSSHVSISYAVLYF